jgi:pyruvate kinase
VISRCKPLVWIVAPSGDPGACQGLAFSYGVYPLDLAEEPADWREFAANWLGERNIAAEHVMLIAGPSAKNPNANHRLELIHLAPP